MADRLKARLGRLENRPPSKRSVRDYSDQELQAVLIACVPEALADLHAGAELEAIYGEVMRMLAVERLGLAPDDAQKRPLVDVLRLIEAARP